MNDAKADDCTSHSPNNWSAALRAQVRGAAAHLIDQLAELVRIPGIAWESFDPAELERSAEAVANLLAGAGFPEVQILRASVGDGVSGGPAVVARRAAKPGHPTVVLYAHHDVQPPGDSSLWDSSPFEPTVRDGRLYGRGAADDKAGIMVHVGAVQAVAETLGAEFGVGITVFIEGEEEAGSPTFGAFLQAHRELLHGDVIIVADSSNWRVGVPALTTSLRGLVDATVEVQVMEHAVHSGMFGGPVLDAPTLLARLISSFHDVSGRVCIPGLVNSARETIDYPEVDYRADTSLLPGTALAGSGSVASRLWHQPALSVIGMDIPSVALSSNTLLPRARAKISMRLAPGDNPSAAMEALRDHVQAQDLFGARVLFTPGEMGAPFSADTGQNVFALALDSLSEAWGVPAVEAGMGGSIPFVADLVEMFPTAQILITGVEDPDSRAHSANESLHLGEFERAVLAEALLLARINAGGLADRRSTATE